MAFSICLRKYRFFNEKNIGLATMKRMMYNESRTSEESYAENVLARFYYMGSDIIFMNKILNKRIVKGRYGNDFIRNLEKYRVFSEFDKETE